MSGTRLNGEAWPRLLATVAMLAAGVALVFGGLREEGLLLVGAALGTAAPAPNWIVRAPKGGLTP